MVGACRSRWGSRGPGGIGVTSTMREELEWQAILQRLVRLRETRSTGAGSRRDHPTPADPAVGSRLEELYGPLVQSGSLVLAQLGETLDGRIATSSGHSHYVTGTESIRHLHRLRALVDAVVVGAGTVIADDPQLTVRLVAGNNPVRVVLDPSSRVPADRRVFQDGAAPTLWVRARGSTRCAVGPADVEIVPLEAPEGSFRPRQVLEVLAARGLHRVLVEGGGITVSRFLDANVLNRLHLTVAPVLLGSGRPSLTLPPVDRLDQALRPRCRHFMLGADVLFDLEFAA